MSTTIDFLDYCFFKTKPQTGYFTEAEYEAVIRTVAAAGIKKIYLRVDVCGLTLYPTRVGKQYAGDGRDPGSTYLVNTLRKYDPARKTIELGHRHGLEVWAWDTLFDDEATGVRYTPTGDARLFKTFGEYPLKDPFLIANPGCQWSLDPRIAQAQQRRRAAAGASSPITKIRITSDTQGRANRVRADQFDLYVSDDNAAYRRYDKKYTFTVTSADPPTLLLEGLTIAEPYVKFAFRKPWPCDKTYTITGDAKTMGQVFCAGQWRRVLFDWRNQKAPPEQGGFLFMSNARFAWDYGRRAMGLAKHAPDLPAYYGMIELSYPTCQTHKLAKLRELAGYPFDGFAYSIRTHSRSRRPEAYGYNDVVRDAHRKQHGRDIWTQSFDRRKWLDVRAQAVNRYLAQAKKTVAPRPLYMDWAVPDAPYLKRYGGLPFQADQWVRDGAVSGIRVLGRPVDQPVEPPVKGADHVRLVRFVDNWRMPPPAVFRRNLRRWLANQHIDEVEFYETLLYTEKPEYLGVIREVIGDQ